MEERIRETEETSSQSCLRVQAHEEGEEDGTEDASEAVAAAVVVDVVAVGEDSPAPASEPPRPQRRKC